MKFSGFPTRMEFTPVPNLFINRLMLEIKDIAELKAILTFMAALYRKKGYPRFMSLAELTSAPGLKRSPGESSQPVDEALRTALDSAAGRGILLRLTLDRGGQPETIYFLNDAPGRQTVSRLQSGEIKASGLKWPGAAPPEAEKAPDIFTLYENNIGMLTPMLADELCEAEKAYPESWLRDAISLAVKQNKRKWSYISAILERWSVEGRSDGAYQGHSEAGSDKYLRQRYGGMVQR